MKRSDEHSANPQNGQDLEKPTTKGSCTIRSKSTLHISSSKIKTKMKIPVPVATLEGLEKMRQEAEQSLLEEKQRNGLGLEAFKARKRKRLRSALHYRLSVCRDDADNLLDQTNFQHAKPEMSSSLKNWLKRRNTADHLNLRGFAEKVAIAASSNWSDAQSFVLCRPFVNRRRKCYPCNETDYCPCCHWRLIGSVLDQEFGKSFQGKASEGARYWYAFTFSFITSPKHARLKLERVGADGRPQRPYVEKRFASSNDARVADNLLLDDAENLRACAQVPFDVLKRLMQRKKPLLKGALAGLDLDIKFFPVAASDVESSVGYGLLIHVHVLANTAQELSWEDCQGIYGQFLKESLRHSAPLYPDLHVVPLRTEKDFQGWLHYTLKPLKFEKFYTDGINASLDQPEAFNDQFDQVVFDKVTLAYQDVRSPRRIGNMYCGSGKRYIGERQYRKRLSKEDWRTLTARIEEDGMDALTAEERRKYQNDLLARQQKNKQLWEWQAAKKGRQHRQARRRGTKGQRPNEIAKILS